MLTRWFAELRFTLRYLLRTPGFSLIAVLALGLGIGANTAIFTGVNALLLGPMPYGHPERLVALWEDASVMGFPRNTPAPANYFDWRRFNHSFTDMAALRGSHANLTGGSGPEAIVGKDVTANFFAVLEAYPRLGRVFSAREDEAGAKVVVISHELWKRRFAGSREVIGQTLRMDNEAYSVIGVMPAGFAYPNRRPEYWRPMHFTPEEAAYRGRHFLEVVGRLKPGVSLEDARSDISAVAARLEHAYPETNRHVGAVAISLRNELVGDTRSALLLLSSAALLVLLIACSNVANLLLIRGAERQRELAVRAAIGASRWQIVGHLLIESLVLGLAGIAVGLGFASGGLQALQLLIPEDLVNASTLSLNIPVVCFAAAASLLSVLVFGLVPALQSSALHLNDALKRGGRSVSGSGNRLQKLFVMSQVALALVLLAGAGLLIQTLSNLRSVKLGFSSESVLTAIVPLSPQDYDTDAKRLSFYSRVLERLSLLPGVQGAGFASDIPFSAAGDTDGFRIEGRAPTPADQFNDALYRESSARYLQTLGVHLVAGRLLNDGDAPNTQPVIVINATFAQHYWPGSNAVGSRVKINPSNPASPWRTVVGVIEDVKERGLQLAMKPALYIPITQVKEPTPNYLFLRTTGNPRLLTSAVSKAVAAVDPNQPIALIRTMDDYVQEEIHNHAGQTRLLGIFAGLALFLAALGIYGVLAYSVTQRRKEIGVRIALGADAVHVTNLVVKQGLQLTGLGLLLGLALTVALTRAMQTLLFGVAPLDPLSLLSSMAALLVAAMLACFLPALTAARVNPILALRDE